MDCLRTADMLQAKVKRRFILILEENGNLLRKDSYMKIKIKVKPGNGKSEIVKSDNGLVVSLKNRTEDGKTNLELVKLLSKYFKSPVNIIKGIKNREKIVEVGE